MEFARLNVSFRASSYVYIRRHRHDDALRSYTVESVKLFKSDAVGRTTPEGKPATLGKKLSALAARSITDRGVLSRLTKSP